MSPEIAAMLMALGCAPASFTGPAGAFAVWVCPPVEEPAEPAPAPPEARPAPSTPEREA